VPTIRFQVLYMFLVLAHDRRRILHFGVYRGPTAAWTAQQLREAFPWETALRYLLRDRDRIFGAEILFIVRFIERSTTSVRGSPGFTGTSVRSIPGPEAMRFSPSAWI